MLTHVTPCCRTYTYKYTYAKVQSEMALGGSGDVGGNGGSGGDIDGDGPEMPELRELREQLAV